METEINIAEILKDKPKGTKLYAEKKVIEDIKKEYQFKPFEKVLVRDNRNEAWRAAFFSYINEYKRYVTTSMAWKYCVPYKGNESLLGTTNNVGNNYG